jgi:hypothetical protein
MGAMIATKTAISTSAAPVIPIRLRRKTRQKSARLRLKRSQDSVKEGLQNLLILEFQSRGLYGILR